MSIPKNIVAAHKALDEWAILLGYRGSIAHGMFVPSSNPHSIDDKDIMGVCVPPADYYHGIREYNSDFYPEFSRATQEIKEGEWDIVVYELRKFIHLLAKGNPNTLALLWVDEKYIIKQTAEGLELRRNKNLFIGKHVYHSFSGYAHSQLHQMTHMAFEGYMGAKRKGLVEKFGYDTKNAAHLVRLLKMAIEFLVDGELHVERKDSAQLLSIKKGEWSLEKVKAEADRLSVLAEEAFVRSTLPAAPDYVKINDFCADLIARRAREN